MGSLAAEEKSPPPHVVCVPYPAQGHITPMLKMAKLLHARGFHVTFVNTEFNHRRLLRSRGAGALDGIPPRFRFATIPDGLPPSDADATQDVPALCYSTMTTCLPHLLSLLSKLNHGDSGAPPVTCLVADAVMSFAYDAAREIGVPCAALWTASACGLVAYRHYRHLVEWGLVPFKDDAQVVDDAYLDTMVHGIRGLCDGMRLRDFPSFIRTVDRGDIMLNFFIHEAGRLSLPNAVMVNTFDDLEEVALDALRVTLPATPLYTVGPLLLHERRVHAEGGELDGLGSNLWTEQDGLLEWLDGHAPGSVVYVNYGSITVMSNEQLVEFAWGLAGSGYGFIWNIRPDLVKGDSAVLPPEFMSSVEGRAKLTQWCPQEAVLGHEAVGLFLTHSGWNSTIESISSGVPMLSWPFFAEQQTNCRYKCTEWGVGMEIGGQVRRAELAEMIREAMGGDKGREMHRRATEWKESAIRATLSGGTAERNLDKVVNEDGLLEWLDGHAPRSVVYVNYGSITVMSNEQLVEFAWGIAGSGYGFIWNIRPDLVKGDSAVLPLEFMSSVEGRAKLTQWCPQEVVLGHEAVGLFLTHSGWNSTIESIGSGVPMLSCPFFAEQQTNCRYKCTEWGVRMEIGGEVRRAKLAEMIREAMGGEKGREMHQRATEWKAKAIGATLSGGTAERNLDKVVNEVLLNKKDRSTAHRNSQE
ncbi:hypothetical protein HU200_001264 [Digitaria exilis]|uniref:Glycosyltransferase N-terminal domain-containing protein n=1 Tax=Digitaria exilis TaxID=1010633 RepID=A0A835G046_9POAL|nr:hypothetical protein HU200_001264 [Digitaria exilis]